MKENSKLKVPLRCSICGNEARIDITAKYLYEVVKRFQTTHNIVVRSSEQKLSLAESIIGLLGTFGVKEVSQKRKKITENGFSFVDIYLEA